PTQGPNIRLPQTAMVCGNVADTRAKGIRHRPAYPTALFGRAGYWWGYPLKRGPLCRTTTFLDISSSITSTSSSDETSSVDTTLSPPKILLGEGNSLQEVLLMELLELLEEDCNLAIAFPFSMWVRKGTEYSL